MLDATLHALAEPRRRQILLLVKDEELSAGAIAGRFNVTRPAISQHLQVLAGSGLVSVRRNGTRRLYRAHPEGFGELRKFLAEFWSERLEMLKQAAEAEEQRKGNT